MTQRTDLIITDKNYKDVEVAITGSEGSDVMTNEERALLRTMVKGLIGQRMKVSIFLVNSILLLLDEDDAHGVVKTAEMTLDLIKLRGLMQQMEKAREEQDPIEELKKILNLN